jgi:hypothetical protein
LTVKKDTERNEELINMKKAWETFESGRSQKAMKARQKFLDSLQPKVEERPSSGTIDGSTKRPESRAGEETTNAGTGTAVPTTAATTEQQQVTKQTPAAATTAAKKSAPSAASKKGAAKDDTSKQAELAATQQDLNPPVPVDEPLLDEPPPSKPKIVLPPLDIKPFIK